jgi:hypothetical protein
MSCGSALNDPDRPKAINSFLLIWLLKFVLIAPSQSRTSP